MATEKSNSNFSQGDEEPKPVQNDHTAPDDLHIDLTSRKIRYGRRPGDIYVRRERLNQNLFRSAGPGHFVAMPESNRPAHVLEQGYRAIKRILIGRPLETVEEINQRLSKFKALAVFGSDPISSCAYATEEAMIVLIAAGSGALNISFFLALAVSLLLSMVAFSYRQTVYAYPHGGGSYNVSRENLGQIPGLVAASALLIDYVLTVSVSIVAGAAAVNSALIAAGLGSQITEINATLPPNLNVNVLLSVCFILVLTWGNLRGIRESGAIFSLPTYLFIVGLCVTLAVGLLKAFTGTLDPASPPPIIAAAEPLTLWLILRAFSAGSVAMSGTEAISNGVPAFDKPESKNAATTLTIMATLLGVFFWASPTWQLTWGSSRGMRRSFRKWPAEFGVPASSITSFKLRRWVFSLLQEIPHLRTFRGWHPCWPAIAICRINFRFAVIGWPFQSASSPSARLLPCSL